MTQAENPEVQHEAPNTEHATPAPTGARRGSGGMVIRLLLLAVVLTVVIAVGVAIIFQAMRSARSAPIEVEIFPDAELISEVSTPRSDSRLYATPASIQQVFEFHSARLGSDESRGCKEIFSTEELVREPGKYFVRCIIDNSQDDITQRVMITITHDAGSGRTLVQYEREWGG